MRYEYFYDDLIEMTHIEKHDVSPIEITEFFEEIQVTKRKRKDESYKAIGRLKSGRYLEVVYRLIAKDHIYVITAYDIKDHFLRDIIDRKLDEL